jgi:Na+:H+ antiporter, NhaA family
MSGQHPEPNPVEEVRLHPKADALWRTGPVWLASDRALARYVGRPVASFLRVEAAGGIILLVAALVALAWANSSWAASYEALWSTQVGITVGDFALVGDLGHWVDDGLMAIFFFVVGLEIKYELVSGELREPRTAALPILAAFGGMVVPAAVYLALNAGGPGVHGWGVPMATDIAFALGVLALLGDRVPASARLFVLTLAIVDDIGAITVIAVFYTSDLSLGWLTVAVGLLVCVVALRRLRVWSISVYLLLGLAVWLATYQSGVHATIAGVAMGLLTPAKPLLDQRTARELVRERVPDQLDATELSRYRFLLGETVPVAERLERALHPWSSYVVLPIFALANAGIVLRGGVVGEALSSRVTVGVLLGLLVGKFVGVAGTSWLVVRWRIGRLPAGTGPLTMAGLAAVAGLGFTVSLFITGLAFDPGSALVDESKVGVLLGSLVAAGAAAVLLTVDARRRARRTASEASAGTDDRPT